MTVHSDPQDGIERTGVWLDAELDRLADALIRREARRLQDAQDAEAKRAAAKEKRDRKARRDLTETEKEND